MQGGSTGTGAGGQEDYLDKGAWRSPAFPSLHNPSLLSPSLSSSPPSTRANLIQTTHTHNIPTLLNAQAKQV